MPYSERKVEKIEISSKSSGGMYRGVNVPIKVLDFVILGGIAIIAALIFTAA